MMMWSHGVAHDYCAVIVYVSLQLGPLRREAPVCAGR